MEQVKHLACFYRSFDDAPETPSQAQSRGENRIKPLLRRFCNLQTFTVVNRRHYSPDANDLVWIDVIPELFIWDDRDWAANVNRWNYSTWNSQEMWEEAVLKSSMLEPGRKRPLIIQRKIILDRQTVENLVQMWGERKISSF